MNQAESNSLTLEVLSKLCSSTDQLIAQGVLLTVKYFINPSYMDLW